MDPSMRHVNVPTDMLEAVVREASGAPSAVVTDWDSERLEGGTVSDVFRVYGRLLRPGLDCPQAWSVVLKILDPWERPHDPEADVRELRVYESRVLEAISPALSAPACYHAEEVAPGRHWLWLQQMSGRTGGDLRLSDYEAAARAIGHLQAAAARKLDDLGFAWLSPRDYVPIVAAYWDAMLVTQTAERVARGLPPALPVATEGALARVRDARPSLTQAYAALPTTFCHREFFPGNLFVGGEAAGCTVAAIDWDRCGLGSIGEDVADLAAGALLDGYIDGGQAAELRHHVLSGYAAGLADGGLAADGDLVRDAYVICIALHWLPRVCVVAHRARDEDELSHYVQLAGELAAEADEAVARRSGGS